MTKLPDACVRKPFSNLTHVDILQLFIYFHAIDPSINWVLLLNEVSEWENSGEYVC